eukprot:scaffold492_cov257-Pinguiococcus_pyrenoidosus.AAC.17
MMHVAVLHRLRAAQSAMWSWRLSSASWSAPPRRFCRSSKRFACPRRLAAKGGWRDSHEFDATQQDAARTAEEVEASQGTERPFPRIGQELRCASRFLQRIGQLLWTWHS